MSLLKYKFSAVKVEKDRSSHQRKSQNLSFKSKEVVNTNTDTDTPFTVEMVPEVEQWLYKNSEAWAAVQCGMEQSEKGQTRYLGSFAKFADISG
jgi:hypothetical protein